MGILGGPRDTTSRFYVTYMIKVLSAGRRLGLHNERRNSSLEQLHDPFANGGPSPSVRLRRRSVHSYFLWYGPS